MSAAAATPLPPARPMLAPAVVGVDALESECCQLADHADHSAAYRPRPDPHRQRSLSSRDGVARTVMRVLVCGWSSGDHLLPSKEGTNGGVMRVPDRPGFS